MSFDIYRAETAASFAQRTSLRSLTTACLLIASCLVAACSGGGGGGGGSGSSSSVPPGISIAPIIGTQPQPTTARVGDAVTFAVVATGSPAPTYQWMRDGKAIAGAQGASYTLATTTAADNGAQFSVVVSNSAGTLTSAVVTLTVLNRPGVALVAGNIGGPGSIDGTGGTARFSLPLGAAVDAAGTVYVIDQNAIRKISTTGVVTTFAGAIATAGSSDGVGSAASFRTPEALTVDAAGNVYVADSFNHTIRKITPAGAVTTLAGLAQAAGTADGTGAAARFNVPGGIAIDGAGNLLVADTNNERIRKVTPAGVVTTIAGSGVTGSNDGPAATAQFRSPAQLTVLGTSVYVADTGNHVIRAIDAAGTVTTIAGVAGVPGSADGAGSAARFNGPTGIAADASSNLYVADSGNRTLRKILPGAVVTTLAGTTGAVGNIDGTGTAARFTLLYHLAADPTGGVYATDRGGFVVRKISATGVASTFAGASTVQGATDGIGAAATFNVPIGVAVDGAGAIYVADYFNNVVRRIAQDGTVSTLAGTAGASGAADGVGAAARFNGPQGIAVDASGNAYVGDKVNGTVRKITPAGVVTTLAGQAGVLGVADGSGTGAQFTAPGAMAVDGAGNVFVADGNAIRKVTAAGAVSTLAGSVTIAGAADATGTAARFNFPQGIAIDAAGNVIVGDSSNAIVRRISQAGVVTTLAGVAGAQGTTDGAAATARFTFPAGVAVDRGGNIFVADFSGRTIRRIDPAGNVSTVAGVNDGLSGVRTGALPGHFTLPVGLAIDGAGNLYVTDANAVLRITF